MAKHTRIPAPPNDGKPYKFVNGKHVAAGAAQKPAAPASERRAKAEKAKAAKTETKTETKSSKR